VPEIRYVRVEVPVQMPFSGGGCVALVRYRAAKDEQPGGKSARCCPSALSG